ncbi:siderophore-interacting protein [Olivibacter sp. SDN3]|uniref:siderophore-interacting protein n=1 Tax=Olivibacter sp. SDN3 TaxID=2764720 RepID=UPI0016519D68|nr:siderophore-interacting protein [Olivibacter sp. SDN3]QNL51012.1 siderophore-interacting protein [Olivibacter sp. SDN3]
MKAKTIKAELSVKKKEWLTPHYIRVTLTGEDVQLIANTTVGVNNKILIPPKGVDKIYFPEFDYEKGQWIPLPEEVRPIVRTYTHRGIDLDTNEIWIDFVAHGEEGPASAWALHATEGDVLGVLMRDGKAELYPNADWYLLAGDATAIPVLGAILESLPAKARVVCVIEVHGKADEQHLQTVAEVEQVWLHNAEPQKGSVLADFVAGLNLPRESRFAYIAAEFATVKAIRTYLRKQRNWTREELYAYSYWKAGVAEEKSAADRQQEKNAIT